MIGFPLWMRRGDATRRVWWNGCWSRELAQLLILLETGGSVFEQFALQEKAKATMPTTYSLQAGLPVNFS